MFKRPDVPFKCITTGLHQWLVEWGFDSWLIGFRFLFIPDDDDILFHKHTIINVAIVVETIKTYKQKKPTNDLWKRHEYNHRTTRNIENGRNSLLRYHRRIQYLSIDFTSACCSHTHTKLIFCAEFYLWALVVAFTVCIYVLTNIESRYLRYGAPFNGTSILDSIINWLLVL